MSLPLILVMLVSLVAIILFLWWIWRSRQRIDENNAIPPVDPDQWLDRHINDLNPRQLKELSSLGSADKTNGPPGAELIILLLIFFSLLTVPAQAASTTAADGVYSSPGMLIILVLILIPIAGSLFFVGLKLHRFSEKYSQKKAFKDAERITSFLKKQPDRSIRLKLTERKKALDFRVSEHELGGGSNPEDKKGLLHQISEVNTPRFLPPKKKAAKRHDTDPELVRLILWYLGIATFWLVAGTSVGEYLGIKFVAPDTDHVSWLGFGRLRPVHTNIVFWGWSSQAMIGLGYYVVTTVSNSPVASIKRGYQSLALLNMAVISGSILLMAGINNGGGEYREYIWPVMALFAAGIALTLSNFLQTIAARKTREIYISNWYIISALMFILVIVIVAYIPFWQNGLGETIIQGYYMHQAVGMWFMMFNLGLIYYFLPQQLNTPIYSYSLGIIAFWSQILFYTVIGTHHFLFSAIPWWMQVVAIIGSVGMLIPVFSGTTNFLMTFRGNFQRIGNSYTLPFYLVGIIFYFTGSTQGTAEAFKSTNLVWHFTDFTIAHSHMTMYGIIAFILWACIYTLVPRLTGNEPKQSMVGAHFWLALIGILFYSVSLMIGGTLKGIS